jgi:hypothetical protein
VMCVGLDEANARKILCQSAFTSPHRCPALIGKVNHSSLMVSQ